MCHANVAAKRPHQAAYPYRLYLFSDALLWADAKGKVKKVKQWFPFSEFRIQKVPDTTQTSLMVYNVNRTTSEIFALQTPLSRDTLLEAWELIELR